MFSLSGSSNWTDFLGAVDLEVVAVLVRVVLVGGSATVDSPLGTSTFLGRPRGLGGSGAVASTSTFLGRPLGFGGAGANSSISGWTTGVFLGRPLGLGSSGSINSSKGSFGTSSVASPTGVFRFVAGTLRVALAFEAAVAILVVLTVASVVFAAARARVTRFGEVWPFMIAVLVRMRWLHKCDGGALLS